MLLVLPLLGVLGMMSAVLALNIAQDNAADVVAELEAEYAELGEFGGFVNAEEVVDDVISALWFGLAATAVIRLLQAVGFGILAFAVLRGSQAGRIITFVLAGLFTVGGLCLGILEQVRQSLRSSLDDLNRDLGIAMVYEDDLLPGWYRPVDWIIIVVSIAMMLIVVWLLTRPAANAYFRRNQRQPRYLPPGRPYPGQPYAGPPQPGPQWLGPQPGPPVPPPAPQPPPVPQPPGPGGYGAPGTAGTYPPPSGSG